MISKRNKDNANVVIGKQVEKYKKIYLGVLLLIAFFECIMLIRGFVEFKSFSFRHIMYLSSYTFLFVCSIGAAGFLLSSYKRSYKETAYISMVHIYCLAIIIWSIIISYLDMGIGHMPIVFLTVIVSMAGLVVLTPSFYIPTVSCSSVLLVVLDFVNGRNYFISTSEIINFAVLVSMALVINARHYIVSVKEFKAAETLEASVLKERNRVSTISLETIKSISNAVDAKDKYTREHSQRVAEYSTIIAKRLNWSESKIKEIHEIGLLHDIGKIGVPDSILNSTSRLTTEEFELMKQHTTIGGEILKDLTILENVDLGAKYHHERFDGTGYPSKLKGHDIPIEARVIAVADAFDAMNSNRVYRKRLTNDQILNELIEGKGKQFDPEIIDAFLPDAIKILGIEEN